MIFYKIFSRPKALKKLSHCLGTNSYINEQRKKN